jgi:hypothetical protein
MAERTYTTTQLDFQNIKASLKTYLEAQPELADYNFDGSVLNNILDVLAYNTHYNGLLANFALNESYLISAQLRSSIVSIAQGLGYRIRSRTAARAYLNISVDLSGEGSPPTSVTLPKGTRFTTTVDDEVYTFRTITEYVGTDSGSGVYTFKTAAGSTSVPVYEGTLRTSRFIVGPSSDEQTYVITDKNVDTSTLTVKVYETPGSSTYTEYTPVQNQTQITTASTFYNIYELPNGYFELNFGDGAIYGAKPTTGSVIVVEYMSTAGPDSNGARIFKARSTLSVNGTSYSLTNNTVAAASGGAAKQSMESIRKNAPLAWAAQQRLVTARDYEGRIASTYSGISDVSAWGGEDNIPPTYGTVFVSIKYDDDLSAEAQADIENQIANDLNENFSVMSIDVDFVEPDVTYLVFSTTVYYDDSQINLTPSALEQDIKSVVRSYVTDNLKTFSGVYRRSRLLSDIDGYSVAVKSSAVSVAFQRRLTPVTAANNINPSVKSDYTITYPASLAMPDDDEYRIRSDQFRHNGVQAFIRNKLSDTKLQIVDTTGTVLVDNIGSYSPTAGTITLTGFSPGIITSGLDYLKFNATPANQSVVYPVRNFLLDQNTAESVVTAIKENV